MFKKLAATILILVLCFSVVSADVNKVGEPMATLKLYSQSAYDCVFTESSLQYAWNSNNYNWIVITDGTCVNGGTTQPSGNWYYEDYPTSSTNTSKSTDGLISGLMPETSYTLRAYLMTLDGKWWSAGSDTIKTMPEYTPADPEFIEAYLSTGNSIGVDFIKATDTRYTEFYWTTIDKTPDYWDAYDERTTASYHITLSGLPYSADIYIWMRSRDIDGVVSQWQYCDIIHTSDRPDDLGWSYTIQSDGDVFSTDYNEATNTATAYIMPSGEWAMFQARINEFRTYKGLGSYSFTTMSQGSDCTPAIINEAIAAINDMLSTGKMPYVSAGAIYASTFNDMRDKLNSIQ